MINFFMDFVRNKSPAENRQKITRDAITINSEFDAATGFWLFFTQRSRQANLSANCAVDGKISPATRNDEIAFTIVYLNKIFYKKRRADFEKLATNPKLSVFLRNQLSIDMF